MAHYLPAIVSVILALIDAYRIEQNWGGPNISKPWSWFYAGIGYVLCIAMTVGYYDDFTVGHAFVYLIYYAGVRGVVFTTSLNVFRGLPFNYHSETTNSFIDQLFRNYWVVIGFSLAAIIATMKFI